MSYIIPSLLVLGQKHGRCGCWEPLRYADLLLSRSRNIPQRRRQLWCRYRMLQAVDPRRRQGLNRGCFTCVPDVEDQYWWLELPELHLGHWAQEGVRNRAGHHEANPNKDLWEVVIAEIGFYADQADNHADHDLMAEVQKSLSDFLGEFVSGLLLETVCLDCIRYRLLSPLQTIAWAIEAFR